MKLILAFTKDDLTLETSAVREVKKNKKILRCTYSGS